MSNVILQLVGQRTPLSPLIRQQVAEEDRVITELVQAMATPQEAERSTGYVLGGISPLGQRRRLAASLDVSVTKLHKVYVSGGRRGLELAPNDLINACAGRLGAIAR